MLRRERPDALLPTMGGGTALNLARELARGRACSSELGIELIGANIDAIQRAEDRELFKQTVERCGLKVPTSRIVTSVDDLDGVSLPAVVRPAFTLGGHGGGFADTPEQLQRAGRARPLRVADLARCSSRSRCAAGTSSSSRSSATAPTTS